MVELQQDHGGSGNPQALGFYPFIHTHTEHASGCQGLFKVSKRSERAQTGRNQQREEAKGV